MNKSETINNFLTNVSLTELPIEDFIINLILGTIIAFVVMFTYTKNANSISNKSVLANQFPLLLLITMFIIMIVKSSLALSLGLVGALSIVRFRTAIKEPSELIYLFMCIGFGLGLGANQRALTIIAFLFIISFIWIYNLITGKKEKDEQNMIITINNTEDQKPDLKYVVHIIRQNTIFVDLLRVEESKNNIDVHFNVKFEDLTNLHKLREDLFNKYKNINIIINENSGLV